MNKLFKFAFTDRGYRLRAYGISGVVALACGLAARFILKWDDRNALLMTTCVLYSLIVAAIAYYVALRKGGPFSTPFAFSLKRTIAILVFVTAGFGGVATHPDIVPDLQRTILDSRLNALKKSIPRARELQAFDRRQDTLRARYQEAQSIVDISYRYKIPLGQNNLIKVDAAIRASLSAPAISKQTKQEGLIAADTLRSLAVQQTVEEATPVPSYFINSLLDLSTTRTIRLVGDHSTITLGYGEIYIRDSTVIFDGINFRSERPYKSGLIVQGADSGVIIRDSTIENLDQALDGVTWENAHFRHSRIEVLGARFTLINVSFEDCDLSRLTFSGVGHEIQRQIAKANGAPISFAFEGGDLTTPQTH